MSENTEDSRNVAEDRRELLHMLEAVNTGLATAIDLAAKIRLERPGRLHLTAAGQIAGR